jgi:hypothetical protein
MISRRLVTIKGQPSYTLSSDCVSLAVTRQGGHMAPVTFFSNTSRPIQPYYISPWQTEKISIDEPVLRPLRGDLFCMPFGGDNAVGKRRHPAHGEAATARWKLVAAAQKGSVARLELRMRTAIAAGDICKRLMLHSGHNAVYCQHELSGYSERMCMGHHATLALPKKQGALRFSSSPIRFGYTSPGAPGPYASEEYFCLPAAKKFRSLTRVPTIWKTPAHVDRSTFPAQEGFTDILAIFPKATDGIAWNTAAVPSEGFVWFALRDCSVLNSTVLWMSDKGRRGAPWNGRNRCLGIEDVRAFFANGLRESLQKNFLAQQGIATALPLSPHQPTLINYIQGVAKISRSFDRVDRIELEPDAIRLIARSGAQTRAAVKHSFITEGTLD